MNLRKISTYKKFNDYSDLLKDDVVLYICSNNLKEVNEKKKKLIDFCKKINIKPKKIYYDISSTDYLGDKPKLQELIKNEENLDIIVVNTSDIYKYMQDDYFDIRIYLKEANLGIFDLNYYKYSLEREPMLYWLGNC